MVDIRYLHYVTGDMLLNFTKYDWCAFGMDTFKLRMSTCRGNQTISADVHFLVVAYSVAFKQLKPIGEPPSILLYFNNESLKEYFNEAVEKHCEIKKVVIADDEEDE
ncbi:hypothetical protein LINPERHAP2_LOCUS26318, partial [Linum perenne]